MVLLMGAPPRHGPTMPFSSIDRTYGHHGSVLTAGPTEEQRVNQTRQHASVATAALDLGDPDTYADGVPYAEFTRLRRGRRGPGCPSRQPASRARPRLATHSTSSARSRTRRFPTSGPTGTPTASSSSAPPARTRSASSRARQTATGSSPSTVGATSSTAHSPSTVRPL